MRRTKITRPGVSGWLCRGGGSGTLERSRPAYQGRFEFFHGNDHRRIEIAPGFSLSSTHVGGQSVQSRIASLDWLFRPFPLIEFSGEAFNGQNAVGLGALPGLSPSWPPIRSSRFTATASGGSSLLFPAPRLSFHV